MKSWREGEGLREEGKVNEEKERRGQVVVVVVVGELCLLAAF